MPLRDFPLEGENGKPGSPFREIQENALGSPISLSAAPTTSGGELRANQLGYNGTNLYINLGGTIYRISMTAV